MSRNADIANAAYEAANARDLDAFLALTHPDCEFNSLIAEMERETFVGHHGIRRWWERVVESLGGLRFDVLEVRDLDDDTVLVHSRVMGPSDVALIMWQTIRVRDGLAVWWRFFRTEQEALAAGEPD